MHHDQVQRQYNEQVPRQAPLSLSHSAEQLEEVPQSFLQKIYRSAIQVRSHTRPEQDAMKPVNQLRKHQDTFPCNF